MSTIIGEKILKIRQIGRPTHVFGVALSSVHHASDLVRIRTLYKYGGIFLGKHMFNYFISKYLTQNFKSF